MLVITYFFLGLLVISVVMLSGFIGQMIGMLLLMLFDIVLDYIRDLKWI